MRKHVKTVHGEAAYRNKKHKGLNSAKHQNGYNKLCSSLITTSATVHPAPGDSNGAMGRNGGHYANGLSSVKSEFGNGSNNDNQLSPATHHQHHQHQHPVQMDTALNGLVPALNSVTNSMNSYLNGPAPAASAERHLSGQFASGLSNHHTSSKLEPSNPPYSQPASLASSHLTTSTTKNESTQFNDLNNFNYYNSTYGGNLLDSQSRPANGAKDDRLVDKHAHQHQQSTNWTPGQLTSNFNNEHSQFSQGDPMIGNPFDPVQASLMPPPASHLTANHRPSMHSYQPAKHPDVTQCLPTDDEGIGSESGTNCTEDDDEPSQRAMNGMQHYSAPNGDGSLLVMTHQPLSRPNVKGSRPSLKNRFKNGIKSWIPTIFHKSSSSSCAQYETAYIDQSELSTLTCSSNYQPAIGCRQAGSQPATPSVNVAQSGKKKTKEGGLKVPFLTKSRKNKSYEEPKECVKESAVPQSAAQTNLDESDQLDQLDQLDLPDEVMQYLKENKVEQQGRSDPRSPMIVSQLSPAGQHTDCKLPPLNSLAAQQPFSPMSVNSPNTPLANPLSPMQTDMPNSLTNNNLNGNLSGNHNLNGSTVNKPPPSYTFATQQLSQQQQQLNQPQPQQQSKQQTQLNQQATAGRCNAFDSSYQSSYGQANYSSYNQQINHSTTSNYYAPNYTNDSYGQMKPQSANGCVGASSKIQRYVNNQNINIYVNGGQNGGGSSAGMMPPFYNCNPAYPPSNCNSYANWHPPAGQQHSMQSASRQSAMSIDTNNNSSYAYQGSQIGGPMGGQNPMPPPITYTQQLSSQLTPPVPSSLLMSQPPTGHPMNEMCRQMNGRCESRCDSRSRLMSPMQICGEQSTGSNMVINDMSSGLTSLAEENRILKMGFN